MIESFVGSLIAICYWVGWKDGKKSERKEYIDWLNKVYNQHDTDWLPKKEKELEKR